METFSRREVQNADSVDLKHLAMTATLLLRDGCDLLDVLASQLRLGMSVNASIDTATAHDQQVSTR